MSFYWIYEIANWAFCALCIVVFAALSAGGVVVTRGVVRRVFGPQGSNDIVSYFLSATGVFYGITLGLIAIGAWQNFDSVSGRVSREAAAVATVCQDVAAMPESAEKTAVNDAIKEYLRYVIEEAWPLQRKGVVPTGGAERFMMIHRRILAIEPKTETDKIVLAEMISRINTALEARRLRLEAVTSGLPALLYWIVLLGGFINVSITWCFVMERLKAHMLLCGAIGALIGLLIFMVAAMDNPFRGEYSVGPSAFELIQQRYFGQ